LTVSRYEIAILLAKDRCRKSVGVPTPATAESVIRQDGTNRNLLIQTKI
jgi:hypothetical protein